MTEGFTFLILSVVWGLICMVMAENRGRNKFLGLASGLAFGIFSILYYWIVGDVKQLRIEKAKKLVEGLK